MDSIAVAECGMMFMDAKGMAEVSIGQASPPGRGTFPSIRCGFLRSAA